MANRDKEKRTSAARRRAEEHTSGFDTTVLKVPDGVSFFDFKPGVHVFDVLPYRVKKGKDTPGGNPYAETGELFFERTYFAYRKIGAEEKSYAALGKTFGKPDPIAEFRTKESKNPEADQKYIKSLNPQERQVFLIWNHKTPGKELQILEASNFCFGKLLDSRVQNSTEEEGWDLFYFPDRDGMTLRVTIEEVDGGGFTFNKATAIDFIARKADLPEKAVNHGVDLDDMLVEYPYQKMKDIFLCLGADKKAAETGTQTKKEDPVQDDEVPSNRGGKEEKEPPREEKKETKSESASAATAESLGIKKGAEVIHDGKKLVVFKIGPDGTMLTLMDDDDNTFKVEVSDVKLAVEEKKQSIPTAEECGLKKDMTVAYQGKECTIFKISPDGTSLTLMDSDDNAIRAIGCGDVQKVKPAGKKEEKKTEPAATKKEEAPAADENDPNWDEGWK